MSFDLEAFAGTTVTDANDTKTIPIPEGEYAAVSQQFKLRTTDKGYVMLDLPWELDATTTEGEAAVKETCREKLICRQTIFLDLNEQGNLDMGRGKNVQLGKLRDALGVNIPGRNFSFNDLVGRPAKVFVKHRVTDAGDIFDEVKSATKL